MLPTGFDPLDDVLAGGIRQGELVLLGGKPGVGKTIASLQWARSMAQRGVVAVYLCFEHDEVTLLTRLLSCELGEMLAAASPGESGLRHYELQARIRDVAAGAITLREALDSDPLLDEAQRRVAAYADRLVLVTGSGAHTDVAAIGDITRASRASRSRCSSTTCRRCRVFPPDPREGERVGRVIEGLKQLALDQKLVGRRHRRRRPGGPRRPPPAPAPLPGLDGARLRGRRDRRAQREARRGLAGPHRPLPARGPRSSTARSCSRSRRTATAAPDVNLEFEKDFAHYRFHPRGRWVAERLWTEGSIEL